MYVKLIFKVREAVGRILVFYPTHSFSEEVLTKPDKGSPTAGMPITAGEA
jgi:hypothetical protein